MLLIYFSIFVIQPFYKSQFKLCFAQNFRFLGDFCPRLLGVGIGPRPWLPLSPPLFTTLWFAIKKLSSLNIDGGRYELPRVWHMRKAPQLEMFDWVYFRGDSLPADSLQKLRFPNNSSPNKVLFYLNIFLECYVKSDKTVVFIW